MADTDAINEVLHERNRSVSSPDVVADAHVAHDELMAALGKLTDADVQKTIAGYGGDPTDDRPLLDEIAGDTYEHYPEHVVWIRELLDKLAP